MLRVGVVAVWFAAACGRIAFDPDTRNTDDAGQADGALHDAPLDGAPGVSCAGLPSTCGPTATSPCCGNELVPGGTFYRSYDVGTDGAYSSMANPATVSDFRLDVYEVTVGRFRQFVEAGMGVQASPPPTGAGARTLNGSPGQGGWDPAWNTSLAPDSAALVAAVRCGFPGRTWTDAPAASDVLPINCVTWFEAFAFCAWDGGFLPTEAEWNYAAAGGSEQRAYAWSSPPSTLAIDCSYANHREAAAPCVNPPDGTPNRVGSASPKGDGRWGHADLGGNTWEWTLDGYTTGSYPDPCVDCANLNITTARAFRGCDYACDAMSLRPAYRNGSFPGFRGSVGIRCARQP